MLRKLTTIGAVLGALLATAGTALAQTYPPPTGVAPTVVTQGGGNGGVGPAVETQAGGLAFTGAEIGLLVLAAALLAGIGAMALIAARRRRAQAA
jgi:hypothetical protein